MDENPGMSAWHVAQELGHKREMVHSILKKVGYFPYQNSMLLDLKLEDFAPCYNYCDWFFGKFDHNVEFFFYKV